MAAITCTKCGGPLPTVALDTVVKCQFCGTSSRIGASGPVVVRGLSGLSLGLVVGLGGGSVLAIGLLVIVITSAAAMMRAPAVQPPPPPAIVSAPPLRSAPPPVVVPPPPEPKGASAADLATVDASGWFLIDDTDMPGGYDNVDPAVVAPWLDSLARAWATDARLQRVGVSGVRADGSLDLRERRDWDVDFRYFSPARRESYRKLAEVSETDFKTEIRFWIREGEVVALLSTVGMSTEAVDAPPIVPSCPLPTVFAAWATTMPKRPFYDATMRWRRGRWRWELGGDNTRGVPEVDEVNCK